MPAIVPQTYRMVTVGDLEPHPDNPHKGDVDVIAESINRNGFYGTVMVQQSRMRIIAGEHRWRGAKANGLEQVPALIVDVDDDAATRIMLADNRTAEHGGYDDEVLADLLRGLPDLGGTGWSDDDLSDLLADLDSGLEIVADAPADHARTPASPASAATDDDQPSGARPRPDSDDEDDFDDDPDSGRPGDMPPPRPKAGTTADLLLRMTAAEHDEMNALLGRIRTRDGDASTVHILLAALRQYAM